MDIRNKIIHKDFTKITHLLVQLQSLVVVASGIFQTKTQSDQEITLEFKKDLYEKGFVLPTIQNSLFLEDVTLKYFNQETEHLILKPKLSSNIEKWMEKTLSILGTNCADKCQNSNSSILHQK